jgi:hypothetical protein
VIPSLPTFPIRGSSGAVFCYYILSTRYIAVLQPAQLFADALKRNWARFAIYYPSSTPSRRTTCQFSAQRKPNLSIIAQLGSHAPPTLNSATLYKVDPGGLGLVLVQI